MNHHPIFHSGYSILHSYQEQHKSSSFSAPLSTLVHSFILSLFDNSHPNGCEVISHFGFDCIAGGFFTVLATRDALMISMASFFSCTYFGEGNGNPLQYSCLENHMERGAWQVTVHRVVKSETRLSN